MIDLEAMKQALEASVLDEQPVIVESDKVLQLAVNTEMQKPVDQLTLLDEVFMAEDTTGDTIPLQEDEVVSNDPIIPTWADAWSKNAWDSPITYGVEQLVSDNERLYRAWCQLPDAMNHERLESDQFEACDEADAHFEGNGYSPLRPHEREREIARAATARALMHSGQRSAQDMSKLADELRQQAVHLYSAWQEEQERVRLQAIEDEKAMTLARQLIQGLLLVQDKGTIDEKRALKKLFGHRV